MKNNNFASMIFVLSVIYATLPILSANADTYTYDAAGRLTSALQVDGYSINYTYDANGNMLSRQVSYIDTVAPVITLTGSTNIYVEAGTSYTDAGAAALDNVDGDLKASIVVSGDTVDIYTIGIYVMTYDVQDAAGNAAAQVKRNVYVQDTILPIITLNGLADAYVEAGTSYTDAGATASDTLDGNLTTNIVVGGDTVDVYTVGTYVISYNVQDGAGNSANAVLRNVHVQDTTPPVISLNGSANINIEIGTAYLDQGATAFDSFEGNISINNIVVGGLAGVDIYTLGTYQVTFDVSDASGNAAMQVVRNVTITSDATPPVITMLGSNDVYVEAGASYVDAGATALDNVDGNITGSIVTVNPVNTTIPATYAVTYNVSDTYGNAAIQVTRTVIVQDTIAPTITLTGPADIYVEAATSYADQGATASDSLDGVISGNIVTVNLVDVYATGSYIITYNVQDGAGNAAIQVQRNVYVQDTIKPSLSLNGLVDVYVEAGTSYTDAGATASDTLDGNLTPNIVVGGDTVDIYTVGTYVVSFNVQDGAGNFASAVQRNVHVQDTTAPLVTPPADINIEATSPATVVTLGSASAFDGVDGLILKLSNDAPLTFPLGTTLVTWSAFDANGNTGTAVQSVTVVDTTTPSISAPTSITLVGDAVLGGVPLTDVAITTFLDAASATDLVDPVVLMTSDAPGLFANGTTITVTFTATDAATNSSTATATVTVNDPNATGGAAPAPSGTGLTIDQTIALGLDPYATTTDSDGDGIDDLLEVGDPANPTDSDGDGLADIFESGASASDASTISGLPLDDGKVDIVSTGQSMTQVAHAPAGGSAPSGVSFPFGTVSYTTTVASAGASQTVRLTFTATLPTNLVLYKVDNGGNYTEIPTTFWVKEDANTISLTLTDGGTFDLDGVANGTVVDPLAVGDTPTSPNQGTTTPEAPAQGSSGGGGCLQPHYNNLGLWQLLFIMLISVWLKRKSNI